jgi:type I restriction enzyme S subunit
MCDPRLLKYFFQSRNYWGQVNGSLSGSAQPGINAVTLSQMEVSLPDLPTQRKTAEILSRYDEKIENNNKIIKNLELSAQAIFDEWFVNFRFPRYEKLLPQDFVSGEIPSGWLQEPLDVIADFLNGIALQKYQVKDGEASLPVIKIREMNSGVDENSERASAMIDPKYIVKSGDVLFSWSGSLELMVWSGENGALNQHIFKVSSATYPKWFFFFWIKHHLQNFRAIASGKATTMGHIQRHHLSESMVNIPSDQILNDADLILRPLFDQTLELKLENTTLKQGRDLLLKKLI